MSDKKYIKSMKGYKATNDDMTCRDHKFELGKWYKVNGDIDLCQRGFHFCIHPSGPYAYYNDPTVRVFEVEAEDVLECPVEAGADFKLVARRIRLVKEITPGNRTGKATGDLNTGDLNTGDLNTGDLNTGNRNTGDLNTGDLNTGNRNTGDLNTGDLNTGNLNTGDRNTGDLNTGNLNTGDRNTGNRNTGNRNTGDLNTGDLNTGDLNTGNWNTGNRNTGNRNTGNWNTGDRNTGDRNTGDRNTGDLNTGNRNTGNRNTGNWNTGDCCAGFFCFEEPKVLSFDVQTDLTYEEFLSKFPQAFSLGEELIEPAKINFDDYKMLPGITKAKLEKLHQQHLARRKKS